MCSVLSGEPIRLQEEINRTFGSQFRTNKPKPGSLNHQELLLLIFKISQKIEIESSITKIKSKFIANSLNRVTNYPHEVGY